MMELSTYKGMHITMFMHIVLKFCVFHLENSNAHSETCTYEALFLISMISNQVLSIEPEQLHIPVSKNSPGFWGGTQSIYSLNLGALWHPDTDSNTHSEEGEQKTRKKYSIWHYVTSSYELCFLHLQYWNNIIY